MKTGEKVIIYGLMWILISLLLTILFYLFGTPYVWAAVAGCGVSTLAMTAAIIVDDMK